jgi:hypothetical protein
MKLLDRLLERVRRSAEIAEAISAGNVITNPNRQQKRDHMRYMRRRGSGWTRPMRKGREQRHPRHQPSEEK